MSTRNQGQSAGDDRNNSTPPGVRRARLPSLSCELPTSVPFSHMPILPASLHGHHCAQPSDSRVRCSGPGGATGGDVPELDARIAPLVFHRCAAAATERAARSSAPAARHRPVDVIGVATATRCGLCGTADARCSAVFVSNGYHPTVSCHLCCCLGGKKTSPHSVRFGSITRLIGLCAVVILSFSTLVAISVSGRNPTWIHTSVSDSRDFSEGEGTKTKNALGSRGSAIGAQFVFVFVRLCC